MITIDSNPGAFIAAGMRRLTDAHVLAIIGRSAGAGIRIQDIARGMSKGTHSIAAICERLAASDFVHAERDGKQGRPNRYFLQPLGRALLDRAIIVVDHSIVSQPSLPLS